MRLRTLKLPVDVDTVCLRDCCFIYFSSYINESTLYKTVQIWASLLLLHNKTLFPLPIWLLMWGSRKCSPERWAVTRAFHIVPHFKVYGMWEENSCYCYIKKQHLTLLGKQQNTKYSHDHFCSNDESKSRIYSETSQQNPYEFILSFSISQFQF